MKRDSDWAGTISDLALINGKIVTVDGSFHFAEAVAIKGDKIVAVGSNEEIKGFISSHDTEVLDLKGKAVLPGINDSHGHPTYLGGVRPPLALDLSYPSIKSIEDLRDAIHEKAKSIQPGEWIRGFGWDQCFIEECKNDPSILPRKTDIDEVSPENPVALADHTGHTLLVNSKALSLAGINKDTTDPVGGVIERDPNTGEPTGIFKELAAHVLIGSHIPVYSREEKKEAIKISMKEFNANGITSFTDAAIGPGGDSYVYGVMSSEIIELYRELYEEGHLSVRMTILLLFGEYGTLSFDDMKNGLETFQVPSDLDPLWVRIPGVKVFADGIPPTKTAWMNEDYLDGGHGSASVPGATDEEQYNELVKLIAHAHKNGKQIGVHATGDRAIDATVDGFIKGYMEKPIDDLRHYVIHGDFLSRSTAERMAKYNFGVAMQPYIKSWLADILPALVGKDRTDHQFPMRMVLDAGINLTGSSDAPMTPLNWRLGMQSAVLRESLTSGRVGGPDQCISLEEAVKIYTINGAWQDHMEHVKGSIEVGKLADLCILEKDLFSVDPHELHDIPVLMTIAGGKIVFDNLSR